MLVAISHLKLNLLRYWDNYSRCFQTVFPSEVSNTDSFLYVSLRTRQIFRPAINMLSGAKPHNVTFHLHLQHCLYLSLVCQSLRWVNTSLWQLLHTFFHPLSLWLHGTWPSVYQLMTQARVDGKDLGDHLRAPITHTYSAHIHTHMQTHTRGKAQVTTSGRCPLHTHILYK